MLIFLFIVYCLWFIDDYFYSLQIIMFRSLGRDCKSLLTYKPFWAYLAK